jgi:hypothetical protein
VAAPQKGAEALRPRRTDANQTEIIEAFRKAGCTVRSVHMVGSGFPDLVVGFGGLSMLIEVKDGSKPPSAQKLTEDEQTFHNTWTGGVRLVRRLEDVPPTVETLMAWHKAITTKGMP